MTTNTPKSPTKYSPLAKTDLPKNIIEQAIDVILEIGKHFLQMLFTKWF